MGGLAMPAVYGLMVGGMGTQIAGQVMSGKAEERAAKFNARLAQHDADDQIERILTQQRRQQAENYTLVAKSGVRVSGSPLAVIEENAFQASKQEAFIRESGDLSAELSKMRGRSARAATQVGIAASAVSGAGQLGGLALRHA